MVALRTFYETVAASVVSSVAVCWGGGCSEQDQKRLNWLNRRASLVCGCHLDSTEGIEGRRSLARLSTIMDNTSHPEGLKQLLQWKAPTAEAWEGVILLVFYLKHHQTMLHWKSATTLPAYSPVQWHLSTAHLTRWGCVWKYCFCGLFLYIFCAFISLLLNVSFKTIARL